MSESTTPEARRAAEITAALHEAPDNRDHSAVRDYVHGLTALGCVPLLIFPNSKKPFDGRTARQRNADDTAAQHAARDAGRRCWQKVKSPGGVHLATDDRDVLDAHLTRYVSVFGAAVPVNVAVSVGRSRLVVVDCDTAQQMKAFVADMDWPDDTAPTVRTPGVRTERGEWIHSDGGHYWFVVPEGLELPQGATDYTDPEGDYSVSWGSGRYVLIPPSARAEGAYSVPEYGAVHELPGWLGELIIERAPAARRVADRSTMGNGATLIDEWSRAIDWAEILAPLGWTPTGRAGTCSCEEWTAPGTHASPKSATAHEPGCAEPRYDPGNPPLHIWTDNPGEPFAAYIAARRSKTLSKLQAVALIDFDNDMGAAMDAHGLINPQGLDAGCITDDPIDPVLSEAVFGWSDMTKFLYARAELRMVSPWAMLGSALLQASGMVPWWVRLPPLVGGDASANLLAVFAGMSGAGKGAAAEPGIDWDANWDPLNADGPVVDDLRPVASAEHLLRERKPGSGQAFAALFMGQVPGINPATGKPCMVVEQTSRVAHVSYPEIDGYTKLATQQGSTVFDVTRQLFDGKNLGEFTKDRNLRSELPPFKWRAVLSMHAQPERCGPLLDDDAGGTPQRIVWIHPDWPLPQYGLDDEPAPPSAEELAVTYPVPRSAWPGGPDSTAYIVVDPAIGRILRNIRRQRTNIRSEHATVEDKQGSHRGLLQLKVAVAVAVLHGRCAVEMSDWELAGLILEHSDRTIAMVRRVLRAEQVKAAANRGHSDEIREISKASAHADEVDTAGQRILTWLRAQPRGATMTENDVRRSVLGKRQIAYSTEALESLVAAGDLVAAGRNRKGNSTYRLADLADSSTAKDAAGAAP